MIIRRTAVALAALLTTFSLASATPAAPALATRSVSPAGHLFVVNLENKGYDKTWGPGSAAPYLSRELRAQGALLTRYYGTAHNSLGNYLAQISGQGPNLATQADCVFYGDFARIGTLAPGQALGQGCVYPADVPTVADQLTAAGRTWRAYLEDMGTPCRHPGIGTFDDTQKAKPGDQYAARHNPFVYFHSILDGPSCTRSDVDLSALPADLASIGTTADLTYLTPNLCHDGHDTPCVDGEPGGLASADAWLRRWVPVITSSPAFRQDGTLVITFDESDGPGSDSSACCGEGPGPDALLPGIFGPGGGRVGALVLSKFTAPGTTSDQPYNHYSLLASVENAFGLPHLGYAASSGVAGFGRDVFNR
ncbi:phosphoesterase [Amycolatopsis cynarae]|uniref:Phosphoesterase n=1 Tax=Amycolatopsis cynarae TaxID=2995223 RepID=A0ABY7BAR7_9PSEU|nr:alkaline phosphatase family protein [Amycolatopsis sp. HUAS 11-8]WAL68317.1 phosphoesterase [Amycolatopsis sp. HUAS 11-8]